MDARPRRKMMKVKVYTIVRVDDNDEDWYDTAIQLAIEGIYIVH